MYYGTVIPSAFILVIKSMSIYRALDDFLSSPGFLQLKDCASSNRSEWEFWVMALLVCYNPPVLMWRKTFHIIESVSPEFETNAIILPSVKGCRPCRYHPYLYHLCRAHPCNDSLKMNFDDVLKFDSYRDTCIPRKQQREGMKAPNPEVN